MTDNVITPEFRAAYISAFHPTAPKDNPTGPKKYVSRAVFMPGSDLSVLKEQAKQAAIEKWGADKVPKVLRSPFRTNEELENPIPGVPDDAVVMTFSMNEVDGRGQPQRPGVVDANLQDIIDPTEVYSGAWFIAQVRAYAYDNAGNKGVSFGLQNLMKTRDDEPMGKGRAPASKAFEAVAPKSGGTKTAGSMFE